MHTTTINSIEDPTILLTFEIYLSLKCKNFYNI